jgi:hypothetical protein
MDDLVQAAVQLAEQPLQDAEEEVFSSPEIIESPALLESALATTESSVVASIPRSRTSA